MNRSIRTTAASVFTALAGFTATAAFADGDLPSYPQPLTAGKSRMEVRAELDAARAAGQLIVNEASVTAPAATGMAQAASRDDVKKALHQAIVRGEVRAQTAEPQNFAGTAARG